MALPLHVRVAEILRAQIADGTLSVGSPLPSESALCATHQASRGTVRAALAALRNEGLIAGGRGRPPVVRDTAVVQSFETFMSFTAWAHTIGRTPGQRTVEVARRGASAIAAASLNIDEGTPVVDVLRLRTLDGAPAMIERSSFIEPVGRLLFDFDPDSGSIYAYLTDQGVDLYEGRHTIDAVAASDVDAAHLDIDPGSPLLRERRRAVDHSGRPLSAPTTAIALIGWLSPSTTPTPAANGAAPDIRIVKEIS